MFSSITFHYVPQFPLSFLFCKTFTMDSRDKNHILELSVQDEFIKTSHEQENNPDSVTEDS